MRAFIIRPFGTQKEIDFNAVADLLIAPALEEIGAEGRETLDIVEAGNIRVDMFRRLLTADLVVADLAGVAALTAANEADEARAGGTRLAEVDLGESCS